MLFFGLIPIEIQEILFLWVQFRFGFKERERLIVPVYDMRSV